MDEIKIYHNILTNEELEYINELIGDKSKWIWRTNFDDKNDKGEKLWYDSILPDYTKLKNYHNFVSQNGKYKIIETAINIITKERQNINNFHYDSSDFSFATYFNNNFKGGRFFYYNENKEKFIINPEPGLTIQINTGVYHQVEEVFDGIRYSLYTFLEYTPKQNKTLL